jgi:hypothetical protein
MVAKRPSGSIFLLIIHFRMALQIPVLTGSVSSGMFA